jgi:Family of unknown function (DUF6130)
VRWVSSYKRSVSVCLLCGALFAFCATLSLAQSHHCGAPAVIPLTTGKPPAQIFIDPPLPGPLAARGVAIVQYCAENLHIAPVFGPGVFERMHDSGFRSAVVNFVFRLRLECQCFLDRFRTLPLAGSLVEEVRGPISTRSGPPLGRWMIKPP